jgi:bacterioferritin-associated ferredoxin
VGVVDRCVCHEVTFARLRELARETGAGVEELSARTGCCTGCGLCRPYVERMLRTGRTSFEVLPTAGGAQEERPTGGP